MKEGSGIWITGEAEKVRKEQSEGKVKLRRVPQDEDWVYFALLGIGTNFSLDSVINGFSGPLRQKEIKNLSAEKKMYLRSLIVVLFSCKTGKR